MHNIKATHTIAYGKGDRRVWEICTHKMGYWRPRVTIDGKSVDAVWMCESGVSWLEFAKDHNMVITDLRTRLEENE